MRNFLAILVLSVLIVEGCKKPAQSINLLGWSEYIPHEVLDGFEKETGIKVRVDAVASNEAMQSKLLAGATKYDLIQPSEYLVESLVKMDRLAPLDMANVPNFKNILPEFRDQSFDPANRFTVPYMSGTVGIVYNADKIKDPIEGFVDVFKPEYARRIIVVDDNREIVTWALLVDGIPINDVTDENVEKVRPMLAEWVKLIRKYDSDSPKTDLLQGNADIGVIWNGEAAMVLNQDKRFKFVVPQEGTHRYIDSFAIPSDAPNKAEAEAFINYCLRPEVSKLISEEWPYTNPNGEARKLLSADELNNPASYPKLDHPQTFHDIGKQASKVDQLMTELRSRG